jgi:hypothetical protein
VAAAISLVEVNSVHTAAARNVPASKQPAALQTSFHSPLRNAELNPEKREQWWMSTSGRLDIAI